MMFERLKYGKCKQFYLIAGGEFVYTGKRWYPLNEIDLSCARYVKDMDVSIDSNGTAKLKKKGGGDVNEERISTVVERTR